MPVRSRMALVALLAVAALASTASASTAARTCRAAQLKGSEYSENGAAGTILLSFSLKNTGAACTMNGYASLILMAGVNPLTTNVVHGDLPVPTPRAKPVRLLHGGYATILVAYSDVVVNNEKRCPDSDAFLVRTPGQTNWLRVAAGATACGGGTVRESPVIAGRHKT
jgi:hypothetical protein